MPPDVAVPPHTRVERPKLEVVTDTEYVDAAVRIIREADTEIALVQFLFVYGDAVARLQRELGEAAARGVKVRVLLDEEVERSRRTIPYLERLGIEAKLDSPEKRTHVKLLLADRRVALFGSSNWSDASLMKTNETNILVEDDRVGEALQRYYESLWSHSGKNFAGTFNAPGITIFFDREYEAALMERLKSAEKIDLQLYAVRHYPNDPSSPSTRALDQTAAAAKRGLPVRVIVEESDYNDVTNEINDPSAEFLRGSGADVRRDPIGRTSHAKMLLTEDGVLIGSSNWGYGAFRQYHELNVFITDTEAVREFREYYERLWNAARDMHP